jgi:hypothetical protein
MGVGPAASAHNLAVTRDNARARPAPVAPGPRSVEVGVDSQYRARARDQREYSTRRGCLFFPCSLPRHPTSVSTSPSSSSASSPGTTILPPCPMTLLYQLSHQRITKILSRLIFSISSMYLCLLVALQKRKVSQFAEYVLSLLPLFPALSLVPLASKSMRRSIQSIHGLS